MYCSNEPIFQHWHLDHHNTCMPITIGKVSGKEELMMLEHLANWSWKVGFDYVSIVFWGEPKFPMLEED